MKNRKVLRTMLLIKVVTMIVEVVVFSMMLVSYVKKDLMEMVFLGFVLIWMALSRMKINAGTGSEIDWRQS